MSHQKLFSPQTDSETRIFG